MKLIDRLTFVSVFMLMFIPNIVMAELSGDDAMGILYTNNIIANGFAWPVTGINWDDAHQGMPQTSNGGFGYADCWSPTSHGSNCSFASSIHTGIDLNDSTPSNDCGKEVHAAADGVVRFAGDGGDDWGGVIMLQHRIEPSPGAISHVITQYGHVAPIASINEGDIVYQGQLLGYLAKGTLTGGYRGSECPSTVFPLATKPGNWTVPWKTHLHFEVRTGIQPNATHWTGITTFEQAATGNCRYNYRLHPLREQGNYECREAALASHGYTNPVDFINSHQETIFDKGTDHILNRCISKFSEFLGARVGEPYTDGILRLQKIKGTGRGSYDYVAYSQWYYRDYVWVHDNVAHLWYNFPVGICGN